MTFDEGAYSSQAAELQKILVVTGLVWGLYGTQHIPYDRALVQPANISDQVSSQFWLRYRCVLSRGASSSWCKCNCFAIQLLCLTFFSEYRCRIRRSEYSRTRRLTSIVLCLTTFALFASTTIFSVNYTLFNQSFLLTDYIKSSRAMWTSAAAVEYRYPTDPLKLVKDYSGLTDCGCTAALTVNVSSASPSLTP